MDNIYKEWTQEMTRDEELLDSFEAMEDPGEIRDQINLEPIDMVVPI